MIQRLGIMLCEEREKMGETQKNIAEGLVSISELCRVEHGVHEIDYFVLQALFERLGKSIDKMELAVSVSEYESISYRVEIERSIEKRDCDRLAELISGYGAYNDITRPVHRQYVAMQWAVLWYMRRQDYAGCRHRMECALACTLRGDWVWNISSGQRLCNQEIRIVLAIVYCQWKQGSTDGQIRQLTTQMEQFCEHVRHCYTDEEEQVKIYPHCAWLLGQLYMAQNRVSDAYAICIKGKKSLQENGSLNPMREMMELEQVCLERMGRHAELDRCRKHHEAVLFLYEAAGIRPESDVMLTLMKSSFQGEFVITNELLRDLRKARGISQEKLCANICSQETLSRIEKGKRSPNKKRLYRMLKRLGMERENYYGFIEADDYSLYEKARQYNRCFQRENEALAAGLLDEIESRVDMSLSVNRQFIGTRRVIRRMQQGELSREQANRQLGELLFLTMPPAASGKFFYRLPFRTEYMILNHIAINLRQDNRVEEAVDIYEKLMGCYKRSRVRMRHHAVPAFMLYTNLAGLSEELGRLERAEEVGREGLRHDIGCCRGDVAGDVLANLSLVFWKRGQPELEEAYLRNGYYLNNLYGRDRNQEKLIEAYRKKFHRELDPKRKNFHETS